MSEEKKPCPSDSPPQPAPAERDPRADRVGDLLRDAYGDALDEPVPDIFAELLRKLG